jgi:hypothetical protein
MEGGGNIGEYITPTLRNVFLRMLKFATPVKQGISVCKQEKYVIITELEINQN